MAKTEFEKRMKKRRRKQKAEERSKKLKNWWENLTHKDEFHEDEFHEDENPIEEYHEKTKEEKEAEKKAKDAAKIRRHRIWRTVNWTAIVFLANYAFWKILGWMGVQEVPGPKLVWAAFTIAVAGIMVRFAEGTDHDKLRRNIGWIITGISALIIHVAQILKDIISVIWIHFKYAITRYIGWDLSTDYQFSKYGFIWYFSLFIAVAVAVSLLWEEQSTDNKLAFARTPQKKQYKDYQITEDDDGKRMLRVVEYKK